MQQVEKEKGYSIENLDAIQRFLNKEKDKYMMLIDNDSAKAEMIIEWQHAINAIDIMLIELKIKYKRWEV